MKRRHGHYCGEQSKSWYWLAAFNKAVNRQFPEGIRNGKKTKTQDGRKLRRYKRRWKVERLFAWVQNYRRVVVRYEYHPDNFLGFVHLACILILLKSYL